jgi:adenosine deaminase
MRAFNSRMGHYFRELLSVMPGAPRREVYVAASLELVREAIDLRDRCGLPIVGFDLAGEEAGYPACDHVKAYQQAQDNFLKKTVHAGEAYGPESIFQAITCCHTNRLGHGTFLFAQDMLQDKSIVNPSRFVDQLVEYIASERIPVEVCPTSNLQTSPQILLMQDHPLRHMLKHNLSICICTDNRLVSNTSVTGELEKVAENMSVTRRDFRNLIIAGFKGSFFAGSYNEKRQFVRKAIRRYDLLARRWLGPDHSVSDEMG